MKMRRFSFNKLARDKATLQLEAKGALLKRSTLEDNGDFLEALTQKIVEELEEVFECHSKEELVLELADLEEALDVFKALIKIDQADIDAVKKANKEDGGSFDQRIFIEYADIPESATEEIEYFSSLPDRYPEIDPKTGKFLEEDEDDDEENFLEQALALDENDDEDKE